MQAAKRVGALGFTLQPVATRTLPLTDPSEGHQASRLPGGIPCHCTTLDGWMQRSCGACWFLLCILLRARACVCESAKTEKGGGSARLLSPPVGWPWARGAVPTHSLHQGSITLYTIRSRIDGSCSLGRRVYIIRSARPRAKDGKREEAIPLLSPVRGAARAALRGQT